jgi:Hormone-sensitive lipase (HSL) N-terminus
MILGEESSVFSRLLRNLDVKYFQKLLNSIKMLELLNKTINFYYLYLIKVEGESEKSENCETFKSLVDNVAETRLIVQEIQGFAGNYDLDATTTPGNGYRSFVYIVEKAAENTLKVVESLIKNRGRIFFRKTFYKKYGREII